MWLRKTLTSNLALSLLISAQDFWANALWSIMLVADLSAEAAARNPKGKTLSLDERQSIWAVFLSWNRGIMIDTIDRKYEQRRGGESHVGKKSGNCSRFLPGFK